MSDWLDGLRHALDTAPGRVSFFFRDDDAGWDDERLFELLDLFERHSMPLDVAAIPSAVTDSLAVALRARIESGPGLLAIHQHGFAHRNHEPQGRKCEFGVTRQHLLQQRDIQAGKERLLDLFGPCLSPIFTPPWNRCTAITGECLRRSGFLILSRDQTAQPLNLDGLFELPVTFDWFARARGVPLSLESLGARLAAAAETPAPVGIMFHHALMDESERRRASELLKLIASHENAQCYLMEQLAPRLLSETRAPVAEASAHWRPFESQRSTPAERRLR
jgi:hypothetical protein